ncbi:MAG TPA: hypothetical protein VKA30_04255, partial [Actinomycetota bacterium]|nr:hypothetical protein [Actinomycetota bacterium]
FGVAAALLLRRYKRSRADEPGEGGRRWEVWLVLGLAAAALVAWGAPLIRSLPIDSAGDTPWHMGLSTQLLNGESTPAAAVTGSVPNYYPWMYHAMIALLARFTPGGRAYDALSTLHVVLVGGSVATLFALGRELVGTWIGGSAAALLGAMSGGLGFVRVRKFDVVLDPRASDALRYLGDLLYKRSYNVAFANLSPPFPRDLGLVLLMSFLLLVVAGFRRRDRRLLMGAGAAIGMAGLTGNESFVVGMGVAALVTVLPPAGFTRRQLAGWLLAPAFVVAAIWFVPIGISYLRLGGFVNITVVGAVNLTPVAILGGWGVSTPLAAIGFGRRAGDTLRDPGLRVTLALFLVTAAVLLGSVLLKSGFGEAFLSISRRHRFWPLLHLAIVLYGVYGVAWLLDWLGRWRRVLAVVAAAGIVAVAVPSPFIASVGLARALGPAPVLTASLTGEPTFLNAFVPDRACHAAVPGNLAHRVFSYTGYRLVFYRWDDYQTNYARIRWKNIYQHIPGDQERITENKALVNGTVDAGTWQQLAAKYQLDYVLAPARAVVGSSAFDGYPRTAVTGLNQPFVLIRLGSCDH